MKGADIAVKIKNEANIGSNACRGLPTENRATPKKTIAIGNIAVLAR
jgi:hypothetical protein